MIRGMLGWRYHVMRAVTREKKLSVTWCIVRIFIDEYIDMYIYIYNFLLLYIIFKAILVVILRKYYLSSHNAS